MKEDIRKIFENPVVLPKEIKPVSLAERLYKKHAGIDSVDTAWELVNSVFVCIRQKLMAEGQCKLGNIGLLYIKRTKRHRRKIPDGTSIEIDYKQVLHFSTSKRMRRYLSTEPCKNILKEHPPKPI